MHVMDTALFYPSRLNLSPKEAWRRLDSVLNNATSHGGVFTVNWHDRSIAPERLWDDFYARLVDELTTRGAWFSTAAQAVSWFRKRRSAVFHKANCEAGRLCVSVTADGAADLPGLRLRFHQPQLWKFAPRCTSLRNSYIDTAFDSCINVQFSIASGEVRTNASVQETGIQTCPNSVSGNRREPALDADFGLHFQNRNLFS